VSEEEAFEMQATVLEEVFGHPTPWRGRPLAKKREPTWLSV
jgi:hypothetical protein